jgi:hypothetical protein
MKKQSLRIFLMCSVVAILAVSSARAQSISEQTADIPFSFTIGDKVFPAGEYSVRRLNLASDKIVLMIQSTDGRMSRIVQTTPVEGARPKEQSRLFFNRYGDQYFLAQVWTVGDRTGLELRRSRSERTLALSVGEHAPERQAIALNPRRR